jgi:hypothetical protein
MIKISDRRSDNDQDDDLAKPDRPAAPTSVTCSQHLALGVTLSHPLGSPCPLCFLEEGSVRILQANKKLKEIIRLHIPEAAALADQLADVSRGPVAPKEG